MWLSVNVLFTSYFIASLLLILPNFATASPNSNITYDYIVVGGGLTGLVVANRLTEDPTVNVLVVEYGHLDNSSKTLIPYYANNLNFPDMFNITSAPVSGLSNASFPVWVGAVVGGGSVVNGMEFDRASAADYDSWEALGNDGWGWSGLLPYFKKSSRLTPPTPEVAAKYNYTWDRETFGDGPLQVSFPPWQWPDLPTFWAGMQELKLPKLKEGAAGNAVGTFWTQTTLDARTQTRSSAYTAYYAPAASRPNLRLVTGSHVIQILFSNRTAVGTKVKCRLDGRIASYYASKEVILAAGAIFTPQLLQLSGVGPRSILEAAKIPVRVDMPAVGVGFQDHAVAYTAFNLTNATFPNPNSLATNTTFNQTSYEEYLASRTGPYTEAHGNSAAWLNLKQIAPDAASSLISDLSAQDARSYLPAPYSDPSLLAGFLAQRQILVDQFFAGTVAVYEFPFNGGGSAPNALQKPLSRGTVYLNASDPTGSPPIVTYNTFQNPFDAAVLFASVNFTRSFFLHTSALSRLVPVELTPGPAATAPDQIKAALLAAGALSPSFAHPSGSCPMMPRERGGCVGSDLRVHGLEHLSIVDASVLPLIPATHLQATMYAVAEKAADLIKARR